jgi:hypothetical protein
MQNDASLFQSCMTADSADWVCFHEEKGWHPLHGTEKCLFLLVQERQGHTRRPASYTNKSRRQEVSEPQDNLPNHSGSLEDGMQRSEHDSDLESLAEQDESSGGQEQGQDAETLVSLSEEELLAILQAKSAQNEACRAERLRLCAPIASCPTMCGEECFPFRESVEGACSNRQALEDTLSWWALCRKQERDKAQAIARGARHAERQAEQASALERNKSESKARQKVEMGSISVRSRWFCWETNQPISLLDA